MVRPRSVERPTGGGLPKPDHGSQVRGGNVDDGVQQGHDPRLGMAALVHGEASRGPSPRPLRAWGRRRSSAWPGCGSARTRRTTCRPRRAPSPSGATTASGRTGAAVVPAEAPRRPRSPGRPPAPRHLQIAAYGAQARSAVGTGLAVVGDAGLGVGVTGGLARVVLAGVILAVAVGLHQVGLLAIGRGRLGVLVVSVGSGHDEPVPARVSHRPSGAVAACRCPPASGHPTGTLPRRQRRCAAVPSRARSRPGPSP